MLIEKQAKRFETRSNVLNDKERERGMLEEEQAGFLIVAADVVQDPITVEGERDVGRACECKDKLHALAVRTLLDAVTAEIIRWINNSNNENN